MVADEIMKINYKIKLSLVFAGVFSAIMLFNLAVWPVQVFALDAPCPDGLGPARVNGLCLPPDTGPTTGITGSRSFVAVVIKVTNLLLTFAGIIAVVVLVIGGFMYIGSGGSEEQAEKGKKAIINAIIGLVVTLLAYTIVMIIS